MWGCAPHTLRWAAYLLPAKAGLDPARTKKGGRRNKMKRRGFEVAQQMPPLVHNVSRKFGEPFDIMRSEVVDWLICQPEVRNALFDIVRESGYIKFDPISRRWYGKERE